MARPSYPNHCPHPHRTHVPYANGETILAEGDTTDAFFYIVKRGHVAVSKELAPSQPISKEPAPAAASPSATQGGGLVASQAALTEPEPQPYS